MEGGLLYEPSQKIEKKRTQWGRGWLVATGAHRGGGEQPAAVSSSSKEARLPPRATADTACTSVA